jgi:aminoglycoside phosphotransferase (APT) family kinase protein
MEFQQQYIESLVGPVLENYVQGSGCPIIHDVETIDSGWESYVYRFRMTYGTTTEDLLLKLYKGQDAAAKARTETDALTQLKTSGFTVPELIVENKDNPLFIVPAVILRYIDLPLLSSWLQEHHASAGILLSKMFAFLARLHSIQFSNGPEERNASGPDKKDASGGRRIGAEADEYLVRYASGPKEFRIPGVLEISDWIQSSAMKNGLSETCFCHMDFHAGNILYDAGQDNFYLIDWSGSAIGDYRFDLAWSILLLCTYGDDACRRIAVESYEKERGLAIKDLEYFEVICGYKRLIHILRLIHKVKNTPQMNTDLVGSPEQRRHNQRLLDFIGTRTGIDMVPIRKEIGNMLN